MAKLKIPDKGVDDITLKYPINDWLAKKKRRRILCVTVGNPWTGFLEDGLLLITHIRVVRQSQNAEPLVERDRDRYVKKWLVHEGGASEDSLRWMSFPDVEKVHLFAGIYYRYPRRNNVSGPCKLYRLTPAQARRQFWSDKSVVRWIDEQIANGEVFEQIWPPT